MWCIELLTTSSYLTEWREKWPHLAAVCCPHLSPSWAGGCLLSRSQGSPRAGQVCSLSRGLRCCGNKARGSVLGSQGWLLAWDKGKEDCIVATATANRVRESLGNPAMFSITKIPVKINSQQASSFFIWTLLPWLCCSCLDTECWKCQSPSTRHSSPGWLPAASWLLGEECYSHRAVLKNDQNDLLSLLNQHSPPQPAACCGNKSWAAVKIKPMFSAAAVNSLSSLSSFLSPCPVPRFGVTMKAETCWEKQCSALFAG